MRAVLVALALIFLPGCSATEDVPPGGRLGPGTKTVTSKVQPSTLVAIDGTVCNVSPRKFEATKVGDDVWCEWRTGYGGGTGGR